MINTAIDLWLKMGRFKLKPQNIRFSTFKVGEVAKIKGTGALVEIVEVRSNLSYVIRYLDKISPTSFKIVNNKHYPIFSSDLVKDATANVLYGG